MVYFLMFFLSYGVCLLPSQVFFLSYEPLCSRNLIFFGGGKSYAPISKIFLLLESSMLLSTNFFLCNKVLCSKNLKRMFVLINQRLVPYLGMGVLISQGLVPFVGMGILLLQGFVPRDGMIVPLLQSLVAGDGLLVLQIQLLVPFVTKRAFKVICLLQGRVFLQ